MENQKNLVMLLIECIVISIFSYILFAIMLGIAQVDGDSMYPTLHDGDTAFINKTSSEIDDIQRFEVVVIDSERLGKSIVKRVIGLPGDTIVYRDDVLYVNDISYDEYFLDQEYVEQTISEYGLRNFTDNFQYTLGNDEFFVLGDNRVRSTDSRTLGPVTVDEITGRHGLIVFPLNNIDWMD